jgi:ElaB/YqjD/DUF883 family membrane-anchored ribosome-binding protein
MPTASPQERRSGLGNTASQGDLGSAASQGVDKLYDQVETLQSELKTLSSKVARIADEGLSRARESVVDTVQDAERAVKSNPFSAIGIAVGVGFLLGILLRR